MSLNRQGAHWKVWIGGMPFDLSAFLLALTFANPALAGPPFVLDDPEPTNNGHWEIYAFGNGTITDEGSGGEAGLDFNYGGGEDLQLTAVLPVGYSKSAG